MPRICDVEGCGNEHVALGMCMMHYSRVRRTGEVKKREPPNKPCMYEGCKAKHSAHGYCRVHYGRYKKGIPMDGPTAYLHPTCSGPECDREARALGLCAAHRKQLRQGRELTALVPRSDNHAIRQCREDDCERDVYARDVCQMHYRQMRRTI